MGEKAFCFHGHFYQPPREDPVSGEIPLEPGAAPYCNWNERIFDQCYRPNVELGNFKRISFNIGPTLFHWWEKYDPVTYHQVILDDNENFRTYGVGNAIAQSYNHTILPLSTTLEKITQIRWGIADYIATFGHNPQGMWLPETAVDLESLDILAQNGIEFTILAPWQATKTDIDPTKVYNVDLPGNRNINVFFYNQGLSGQISFNSEITQNGDKFIDSEILIRLNQKSHKNQDEILMIASDGELYGHHQPFRDMFLAYVTGEGLNNRDVRMTYPGLWLKSHPPESSIKIKENTSWSCHHGVSRWSGLCYCTPNASWKKPLRIALENIAGLLDNSYYEFAKEYVDDPWELRHCYYPVMHRQMKMQDLLFQHGYKSLEPEVVKRFSLLMHSQYERQRMFASCGWFFDDLDRIEPLNNVAYAAQAVWLNKIALDVDFSEEAKQWLQSAVSWRTGLSAGTVFWHHFQNASQRGANQI